MSNGKNDSSSGAPKRPAATIDLEAKEVEIRDLAQPGAQAGAKPGETGKSADARGEAKGDPGKPADAGKAGGSGIPGVSDKAAAGTKPDAIKVDAKPDVKPAASTTGAAASTTASTAGKASPPPAAAKGSGGSFVGRMVSHLAAGGLGAFLALFGAEKAAQLTGINLPTPVASQITDLTARIATLDQKLAEAQSDNNSSTIREQVKRLQLQLDDVASNTTTNLGALKEQTTAQIAAEAAKLQETIGQGTADRLTKMEQTFETMAKAAADGDKGKLPQLAGLISRLDALEASLDGRLEVVQKSVADGLQKQQVRLEERLAAVDKPVELETVKAAGKQLAAEVVSVKANAEKLAQDIQQTQLSGTQVREELAALKQQAQGLEAAMKGEFDKVVKADQFGSVTGALAKVQTDLSDIAAKEKMREESASRIVLALELANLKRAMERGGGFEKELAQVKSVAPEGLDLKALEATAKAGLPTQAVLAKEFRETARTIVTAEAKPAENGSFLERLVAGASTVVRVRKTGNVEGQSGEAIVARMEQKLADGDLEATLKEAEGLTGAAKEAATGWIEKLSARLSVDRAMATVDEGLRKVIAPSATP